MGTKKIDMDLFEADADANGDDGGSVYAESSILSITRYSVGVCLSAPCMCVGCHMCGVL